MPAARISQKPENISTLAAGARVAVRNAEWSVRRVDRASSGSMSVTCVGISERVLEREAVVLDDLEKIRVLAPEETVLVAKALSLTLDELCSITRIQFPVLRQNEQDTWYDQTGRIVFTCSKGLPGVGFSRPEWNNIKDMQTGTVTRDITDNTQPTGPIERTPTYQAPFTRCDREEDYRFAWKGFGNS